MSELVEFTVEEALRLADANADAYTGIPSVSRTLAAEVRRLQQDAQHGRDIADAFLPVMEAMRPLVLNLERLRDAVSPRYTITEAGKQALRESKGEG
ncbi:hypothetical protein [Noviluteimonas dokdonensis]|uniref:hypothetical protein n=1 Tax=Noviluteimonas dokdonensis TaxID=414050 RepID=UPI000565FAA0|nr:hypothetical protein [Lysobacter dokdonensis]